MARRTSSLVRLAAPGSAGRRARETRVFTAERVDRFRSRFLMEARTRFLADWVFAMRAVIIREKAQLQWHPMSSERRRIASAATLILVAYGLSRVLGAVRELVIANIFGTSHQIDDYRVAFGVPDLLFNLLLAGGISSAFIPVLSEHLAKGEHQRALEIGQRVLNSAIVILTIGAAILFVVAPFFVAVMAVRYRPPDPGVVVAVTRILLLEPIFLGGGGMVIGILTAYQRFFAQALAPLFYNGAIIVAAAFFAPRYGVTALAVGVVVGAMLHVGVQLPSLWRTGWRPALALGLDDPGVRKVGRLMFPIALGLAAAQVNVFVDTILGTSLPHGRVAALRYADTIAQLPLGTFSQALAFVLFPFLARDAAVGAIDSIRHRTALALRLNIFVLVPASVGIAILGVPITAALLERGQFGGLEGRAILRTVRRALIGVVPMAVVTAGVVYGITGGSLQGGLRPLIATLAAVALAAATYLAIQLALRSEEVGVALSVIRRDRSRV